MTVSKNTLELSHISTLLDVVLGVIIALPLLKLPVKIEQFILNPNTESAISSLLLMGALIFTAFYWLEVRHFLEEQQRFNLAIGRITQHTKDGVPLPIAIILLGSLAMMTVAAGSLKFAIAGSFRAFIIANLLYWVADVFGTCSLKTNYRPLRNVIEQGRTQCSFEYAWFAVVAGSWLRGRVFESAVKSR